MEGDRDEPMDEGVEEPDEKQLSTGEVLDRPPAAFRPQG